MSVLVDYTSGAFAANKAQKVGTITEGTGTYNLSVASYDGVSFSVATEVTSPYSILFGDGGLKLYVLDLNNDDISQYNLTQPYDLSTASFAQSFSVSTQEAAPTGMEFKPDGTKLYVVGYGGDEVNEYTLSTAWDISSASFVQNFSIVTQTGTPRDIVFHPSGDRFWVVEITSDSVFQYNLTVPWDISSASYASVSFSFTAQDTSPVNVFFTPAGTKMFMLGDVTDTVYQYSLTTAYDVSTASYDSVSFSASSQEAGIVGLAFKSDGTKMYLSGINTDTIYQYSTGTATSLDASTGNYFAYTPTADTTFTFSNAPASGTATGFALALTGANVGSGYDLANASYDSVSFSVAGQESTPQSIFFRDDGLKVYVAGNTGNDVNEYDLSTAWDASSATFVQNFSVSTQESTPQGAVFKGDGTKMYVVGSSAGGKVHEYDLSTAWDISTASFLQTLDISTFQSVASGLFFKSDGTKMFTVGRSSDDVNEFNLSTAWDISSASQVQNFSVASQETDPSDLYFSPDGTQMFIVGYSGDDVNEYNLSTAWDISTAVYSENFSVASQETLPLGLFFKPDGSKMYIVGQANDTIYQYSTA